MTHRLEPRPFFDARMMIHASLSVILFWLGAVLAYPGDTFSTSPAWTLFPKIASENSWAIVFFAVSLYGALGVATQYRWLKFTSILLLATMHGTLGVFFFRGNPIGGATGIFLTVAAQGYYMAWRQAAGWGWTA